MTRSSHNAKILVSANALETRIALLADDRLAELYLESAYERRLVGNIYKGRVARVLPGMQAAFVDLGLGKDAFYYVDDIHDRWADELDEEEAEDSIDLARAEAGVERAAEGSSDDEGEDRQGDEAEGETGHRGRAQTPSISQLLRRGQDVLVQVAKEPIGTKGPRVTSNIGLPGRYLVLMPAVNHIGVSRRIEDPDERARLRALVGEARPRPYGFIVRTAAEGHSLTEIEEDMNFLIRLWDSIRTRFDTASAPSLLHEDLDPILRAVRDFFNERVERMIIDYEPAYLRCIGYTEALNPALTSRVRLYTATTPMFEKFGIEREIHKLLDRKVWLKSGGHIVIEQTEALVAIDVNTGRFVGSGSQEETITQTNLEAATEIARQLRLRNLGGIIVIDFIDMSEPDNRTRVLDALKEALKQDRAPTKVLAITDLGLVEMTRKRVKRSLTRALQHPCPYCSGTGLVRSPVAICLEIYRQVARLAHEGRTGEVLIRVHPDIAKLLRGKMRAIMEDLEGLHGDMVTLQSDETLHLQRFDVVPV